uniref:Zn(2)-C6 fungal-type domain-containing protein n=2 Tax=Kalmanozyma brasiliensis (strain GHG001) TaxID=1365824 RepID=V5F2R6_KALBG
MSIQMAPQRTVMPPTSYPDPDASTHGADASTDAANQDEDAEGAGKRRRVQRACDTCRKKKVRCDGLQPDKGACTNCANYGYECTFVDAARKRAPPRSYVEAIEARIVKMEQLIASLAPGVDFTDRIGKPIRRPDDKGDDANNATAKPGQESPPIHGGSIAPLPFDRSNSLCQQAAGGFSQMLSPPHAKSCNNSESDLASTDEDSEDDIAFIETRFGETQIKPQRVVSSATTATAATTFDSSASERFILGDQAKQQAKQDSPSHTPPTHKFIGKASGLHSLPLLERLSSKTFQELGVHPTGARSEFWAVPSGFIDPPADPITASTAWPAPDLAETLIDAYFSRLNREYPVVNEAQYRHEYTNQPELRKAPEWLALSFCIFMVGSQYVTDERVRAFPQDKHSRGMHWWQAAKTLIYRNVRVQKPLAHIQCLLLSTLFQFGLPISASSSWLHLGAAIRILLDVGAHRKQTAKKLNLSRIEDETYKRVFWVAYSLDRECASCLGRPIMLQDEDIDLDLPVEIDDEYLFNTPEDQPLPQQPSDTPALISGFLCSLRLDEIVGRTLKTIYALHKTKVRFGIASKEWDERLVTEIDSALNTWLDTVPAHLRYDPHESDDEWLLQSSYLYSKYYNCQLLVHRPFIAAKKGANESSILNFPSLAICTNAARSISHLLHNLGDRQLHNKVGNDVAFRSVNASTILLMVVWGAKRNGGRVSSSASTDLRRSIDVLRAMEDHWQFCGKAVDFLESIMAATHVVVPRSDSQSEQGTKRSRDGADAQEVKLEDEPSVAVPEASTRPGGASRRGSRKSKSKVDAAYTGRRDQQPLAPEARQLPLSTSQLAVMTPQSHSEPSPRSATLDSVAWQNGGNVFGETVGLKTPQPAGRARMPSLSGASGLAFGLMTPSLATGWGVPGDTDYLHGPHSQSTSFQNIPAVTPSIFDSLGLPGNADDLMQGGMPDMSQFAFPDDAAAMGANFDHYYPPGQTTSGDTPQSDSSSGLASYAFELLQNQSVYDSLNLMQQRGQ